MTKDKAEKRATRARMAKTGERYTTARLYALDLHQSEPAGVLVVPDELPVAPTTLSVIPNASEESRHDGNDRFPEPRSLLQVRRDDTEWGGRDDTIAEPEAIIDASGLPPRVADPGVSDTAVQRSTGKGWDEWFALLDAWDGTTKTHAEIARYLHETYDISGWWAQGVTVGYERARGMRALHERPDGFSMNASKTFFVPVERLFAAIVEEDERTRWMRDITLRRRTCQPNKTARFDVLPDDVRLAAYFTAKGADKASVAFQQERLADAGEVARWKALWREQFAHLVAYLAGVPSER